MSGPKNSALHARCEYAGEIFQAERTLRETAKATPDFRRAAQLADEAIAWQRRRFAHEAQCRICQQAEGMVAA